MKELLIKIGIALFLLAAAFAAGRYTTPTKVVEKEKIVYKDRIVEKKVYVKQKDVKKNVVTIRFTTIKPDGTRTIETKTYDKTEIDLIQHGESNKTEDKEKETDKEKTVTNTHDDWMISGLIKFDKDNLISGRAYGVMVNRRVLGPLHLGAFIFNDATFGASLGISF